MNSGQTKEPPMEATRSGDVGYKPEFTAECGTGSIALPAAGTMDDPDTENKRTSMGTVFLLANDFDSIVHQKFFPSAVQRRRDQPCDPRVSAPVSHVSVI
jgi:hypothetical protein